MPRQTRANSGTHNPYAHHLPVSLAPSHMYNQQRMAIPTGNYYNMPSTSNSNSMQMPPQHTTQQPLPSTFDGSYSTNAGPPVSLPPSHRPSSGAWTPADDQQLMQARAQGLNWSQIKDHYFPSKTANACRKRHERLAEKRDADDWDNRKLQRLAKEYMAMRKEIWSALAARTGEKWNVVEQKCMSNGLKNLQSAARAASRHDRLQSQSAAGGPQISGYDDDSGISGIALTPVDELDASYSSPETSSVHSAASGTASYSNFPPPPQHAQHSYLAYSMGGGGGGGYAQQHRYSSSVSSTASGAGYGGASNGGSPYMPDQRLPSVDMGIGAIINRPGGGLER